MCGGHTSLSVPLVLLFRKRNGKKTLQRCRRALLFMACNYKIPPTQESNPSGGDKESEPSEERSSSRTHQGGGVNTSSQAEWGGSGRGGAEKMSFRVFASHMLNYELL